MPFTLSLRANSCLCRSKLTLPLILNGEVFHSVAAHLYVESHVGGWPLCALRRKGPVLSVSNGEQLGSMCNPIASCSIRISLRMGEKRSRMRRFGNSNWRRVWGSRRRREPAAQLSVVLKLELEHLIWAVPELPEARNLGRLSIKLTIRT